MNQTPDSSRSRSAWRWIAVGLVLWGIYLAVGATGVFTDVGLLDPRRSLIVLGCSAAFVGSWVAIVWYRGRKTAHGTHSAMPDSPMTDRATTDRATTDSAVTTPSAAPMSRASVLSVGLAGTGYASWIGAWLVWNAQPGAQATYVLGYISAAMFGASAIAALVGLSDPRPARGKLLGLVTLLLLGLAAIAFIVQVQMFVHRS